MRKFVSGANGILNAKVCVKACVRGGLKMPKALIYKAFGSVPVARDGLEPPQTAPKTVVLPLDNRAMLLLKRGENN
jgi:hypothetical protein